MWPPRTIECIILYTAVQGDYCFSQCSVPDRSRMSAARAHLPQTIVIHPRLKHIHGNIYGLCNILLFIGMLQLLRVPRDVYTSKMGAQWRPVRHLKARDSCTIQSNAFTAGPWQMAFRPNPNTVGGVLANTRGVEPHALLQRQSKLDACLIGTPAG